MLKKEILCEWPIKFLQDNLRGVCSGDFIVIACASGAGKSTLSRLIAMKARDNNQPVVLYSLENQVGTFLTEETRIEAFRDGVETDNTRDFAINNTLEPAKYEKYRMAVIERGQKTSPDGLRLLMVHEDVATTNWTIARLIKSMKDEIAMGYKLFIIDHLDVLAPNDEYKENVVVMRELWNLISTNNIGLITFSQLRKNCSALCPGQNDLRGGMNKVYKATHLITLGRHDYGYYSPPPKFPNAKPTYVRIAKSRDARLECAVCYFDRGFYLDAYTKVICDEPGNYIDGMTRDKLQRYKKENERGSQ